MSKTYRRRRRDEECEVFERKSEQPEVITAEWAVGRMAEHVNYELERMIANGEIDVADKADYAAMINRRIVKSVPTYDGECSGGRRGRAASAVHYFTVVVGNEIGHIRRYLEQACRNAVEIPIAQLPSEEARAHGFLSPDSSEFSEGCRGIRQLELRMDVNTLVGMLKPCECTVLKMRICGFSNEEIADELGCCVSNLRKTHLKNIRRKARRCGFVPASDMRKGAGR